MATVIFKLAMSTSVSPICFVTVESTEPSATVAVPRTTLEFKLTALPYKGKEPTTVEAVVTE